MAKVRPSVELLEHRLVLTSTQLVLDFTPDRRGTAFKGLFTRNPRLTRLLDMNRDGRVTLKDADLAARRITQRVGVLFSPFRSLNVFVQFGDVRTDTQLGLNKLEAGWSSDARQVAVMYVSGDRNPYGNAVKGEAPLAPNGTNVEGSGRVYGGSIMKALAVNQSANTQTFVDTFAALAAHEFGHMLGLRHTSAAATVNLMNPAPSVQSAARRFINQMVLTQGGRYQNAVAELRASFRGQRDLH